MCGNGREEGRGSSENNNNRSSLPSPLSLLAYMIRTHSAIGDLIKTPSRKKAAAAKKTRATTAQAKDKADKVKTANKKDQQPHVSPSSSSPSPDSLYARWRCPSSLSVLYLHTAHADLQHHPLYCCVCD